MEGQGKTAPVVLPFPDYIHDLPARVLIIYYSIYDFPLVHVICMNHPDLYMCRVWETTGREVYDQKAADVQPLDSGVPDANTGLWDYVGSTMGARTAQEGSAAWIWQYMPNPLPEWDVDNNDRLQMPNLLSYDPLAHGAGEVNIFTYV